ncbi:MAG: Uma2 family endonuclease [Planctomycetota bacterium]
MPELLDPAPFVVNEAATDGSDTAAFSPRPMRVTVEMYHQMIGAGLFENLEGCRVELLDGKIIEMAAAQPPHAVSVDLTTDALKALFAPAWAVRTEKPVTLSRSEPEPDVAVANQALKFWSSRHPGASDLLLVVEVSDNTLHFDRTRKASIYARSGISPYWIVNLPERVLEVRTDPYAAADGDAGYRTVRTYHSGETIGFTLADRAFSLTVNELLPAAPNS